MAESFAYSGRSVNLDFLMMFTTIASLLMDTFWFKDVDFECVPTYGTCCQLFKCKYLITSSVLFAKFLNPIRNFKVIA